MNYLLTILFLSLSFYKANALDLETIETIKTCFLTECEGRNTPGSDCSTFPGGPLYAGPGGDCYAGPGGPLHAGPGGPLSSGPGGPLHAGPGGALDAGPGGACYAGPNGNCELDDERNVDEETCPTLCSLQYLILINLIRELTAEEDTEDDQ